MGYFWARGLLVPFLAVMLAACNLQINQGGSGNSSVEHAAATIVAMTMQARGGLSGKPVTPFVSPAVATPTTKPTVSIHTDGAKCKSGPGTNFEVIASFNVGTTADLIGKDTADGYWVVKDPTSGSSCWLQIQDATPAGSFEMLPELTPQASTQNVPGRPILRWNFQCTYNAGGGLSVTTDISWRAPSGTVNGYRIYRQGTQIAEVSAGTKSFTDTTIIAVGDQLVYGVEAYSDAGAGPQDRTDHDPGPIKCQ